MYLQGPLLAKMSCLHDGVTRQLPVQIILQKQQSLVCPAESILLKSITQAFCVILSPAVMALQPLTLSAGGSALWVKGKT